MRILIDQKPHLLKAGSVEEAIAGAADVAGRDGRVIVEVMVDGVVWNAEQLEAHDRATTSAEEVRFISANMAELVCQTLADASSALTEADELQRESARLLQSDEPKGAMTKLGGAVDIWMTVHEAVVKSAEALEIDLEALAMADRTVQGSIDQLNQLLRTVREGLTERDTIGLSDALLYEFPEVITEWRELLLTMQNHIQSEQT